MKQWNKCGFLSQMFDASIVPDSSMFQDLCRFNRMRQSIGWTLLTRLP
jgi:hypothetical protein